MNKKKILSYTVLIVIVGLSIFCYYRYCWVFGTGTRAGVLNTFMKKGIIFKTWEGKIIQSGFKANIQSNEFEFSVESEKVAEILRNNSGREVEVQYREYISTLPWRGMQKYIVDSVYEIRGASGETIIKPK